MHKFLEHHPLAKETLDKFGFKEEPFDEDSMYYEDDSIQSDLYYPTVEYEIGDAKDSPKVKFQCDYCEKSFGRRSHLKRHVNSVHDGIKFKCNICELSFTKKDNLKRHVNSVHADKVQHSEMLPEGRVEPAPYIFLIIKSGLICELQICKTYHSEL